MPSTDPRAGGETERVSDDLLRRLDESAFIVASECARAMARELIARRAADAGSGEARAREIAAVVVDAELRHGGRLACLPYAREELVVRVTEHIQRALASPPAQPAGAVCSSTRLDEKSGAQDATQPTNPPSGAPTSAAPGMFLDGPFMRALEADERASDPGAASLARRCAEACAEWLFGERAVPGHEGEERIIADIAAVLAPLLAGREHAGLLGSLAMRKDVHSLLVCHHDDVAATKPWSLHVNDGNGGCAFFQGNTLSECLRAALPPDHSDTEET